MNMNTTIQALENEIKNLLARTTKVKSSSDETPKKAKRVRTRKSKKSEANAEPKAETTSKTPSRRTMKRQIVKAIENLSDDASDAEVEQIAEVYADYQNKFGKTIRYAETLFAPTITKADEPKAEKKSDKEKFFPEMENKKSRKSRRNRKSGKTVRINIPRTDKEKVVNAEMKGKIKKAMNLLGEVLSQLN